MAQHVRIDPLLALFLLSQDFVLTVGETRTLDVAMELAPAAASVEVQEIRDALTYSDSSIKSVTR